MNSPSILSWIKAFRLRTLPLALSSILMGSFLAIHDQKYNWWVIILAAVTTILLQILSNLANDYGDSQKGTDNVNRLGPQRTVQSGEIKPEEMKKAIILFVALSLTSGMLLIYVSFKEDFLRALVFLLIGVGAIAAAIKYTVGKGAYGYIGLGDVFVFLFFGLAGVVGTYYLNAHMLEWDVLLPAISLGFLSMGVLNLNNMRDIDNDIRSGKHTLAARLGLKKAKKYHVLLVMGAIFCVTVYVFLNYISPANFLFVIAVVPIVRDLLAVMSTSEQALLDPFLKKLALSTLLFTILFGVGILM